MIGISFWRILRNALQNFQRNIWLSLATTIIMTLTLLMATFLYFLNVTGTEYLRVIEQKVDLAVTFKNEVRQDQIEIVAGDIESRSDVAEVRIVTSDQALEQFRRLHADDPFFEESLQELGENPLPASLYVVATDPRHYQTIAGDLEKEEYKPFIEKINYDKTRGTIDKLIIIMGGIRNVGLITTAVLATLVIMIMFNTIRLAIYSFREEIDIMRLVGASNWFIRGPFIFEAMFVSILSVVVTNLVLYPILDGVAPSIERYFFSAQIQPFNIYEYAVENWPAIIGLQLAVALGLAVFSSFIAIRRYLRG